MNTLYTMALQFRTIGIELEQKRDAMFPRWSLVKVESSYAITTTSDGCPPDKLALRFENGNVWWKHVERCERVDARTAPRSARRMLLEFRGFKLLRYAFRKPTTFLP